MEKKADGLIDLPTAWEYPLAMQQVIPADSRDFSRPKPIFQEFSYPSSMNLADDDPFTRQVQQFLASHPLGISYNETPDGILSTDTLTALKQFELLLNQKTSGSYQIVSGNSIRQAGFLDAVRAYRDYKKTAPKPSENKPVDLKQNPEESKKSNPELIKQFQIFFSTDHPGIGQLYHGTVDGEINPDLINAAKNAESFITNAIGKSAGGMLWNGTSFNTSTDDLNQALQLINKKQNK